MRPTPARVPPTAGRKVFAAPVKAGDEGAEVVGPTGVLVGEPGITLVTLTVPLLGGAGAPVPVEMIEESVVGGQGTVVVKVLVMVVPWEVMVVVPVEVVLLDTGTELDVAELAEADEVDEEIGVQFGRVIVPFPQPPDEHSTRQLLLLACVREKISRNSLLSTSCITGSRG
jgi:hypothetical protein